MPAAAPYPARLEIDYPERLSRWTTLFRLLLAIPIALLLGLLGGAYSSSMFDSDATVVTLGTTGSLFFATLLTILFRQRYPRWWFEFVRELTAFGLRVGAYYALMTDRYPAIEEEQSVHFELDYPEAQRDLNRFLPLVKWLLAVPHYVVLIVLYVGAVFVVVFAWFAVLFTARYPQWMFNYLLGVTRWSLRVQAYVTLLVTDRYPPFRMGP